jgi:hypothetical protein
MELEREIRPERKALARNPLADPAEDPLDSSAQF